MKPATCATHLGPSARAEEHSLQGAQVCRRTPQLRELTGRVCLNGAAWRAVSYAARPASEHHRLPVAQRRDTGSGVRFFCLLFFRKKKRRSPAGATSRPLPVERSQAQAK
jgi:hypothetical protein